MLMKKLILSTFLVICGFNFTFSQIITGKVISSSDSKIIENVAIQTDKDTGTFTNLSGLYTINIESINTITFSCLGYATKSIAVEKLKQLNFTIVLEETSNELNEVFISNKPISLDSLMIKATRSMNENYISEAVKQDFYVMERQKMNFKKLELDLKKSTLLSRKNKKEAQKDLVNFAKSLMKTPPSFSKELRGSLISKKATNKKTGKKFRISKIKDIDGYRNVGVSKNLTLDNIEEKLQNIILRHLNKDKTYKIKSGLFKVEDSLSYKEISKAGDSIKKDNSFNQSSAISRINEIENKGFFTTKNAQYNFLNRRYYNHKLKESEALGAENYYVIIFNPRKSKAKFSGKIYIDPFDYTLKKVIYKFAEGKRGKSLNLKWTLGVKFSENEKATTLLFEKTASGKVYTSYYKNEYKNYAYVNRPIKFIENSKDKEKVKFNIKIEVLVSEKIETLLFNALESPNENIEVTEKEFKKRKKYLSQIEYVKTNWKNKVLVKEYLNNYQ